MDSPGQYNTVHFEEKNNHIANGNKKGPKKKGPVSGKPAARILGNTRPESQSKRVTSNRRWCFTLNNYNENDMEILDSFYMLKSEAFVMGYEIGDSGTPHIQGWVRFIKTTRPMEAVKDKRIHWERQKGTEKQAYQYCWKGEDEVGTEYLGTNFKGKIHGVRPKRKLKIPAYEALYSWQLEILNIVKEEPDGRHIYWYYDRKCGAGKTTFCKYLVYHHGALILGSSASNMMHGIATFKERHGDTPELLVMNFTKTMEKVDYDGIEKCKDMCFFTGKYESDMIIGNCPHMIIFSNEPPPEIEKLASDRWRIYDINKELWINPKDIENGGESEQ